MPVTRSCSWCHEANEIGAGPVTCRSCGHRADLPRSVCDCPRCLPPDRPAIVPAVVPAADGEQD